MAKKKSAATRSATKNKDNSNVSTEKWLPIALAAFAFLFFSIGFKNEMLLSDPAATFNNPAVTDFALISDFNLGMYAPLTWMGYALAYLLGEEGSFWYHLLSAMVHAVNVLLVFRLFQRIGTTITIAGLIAFFFAIHPIQVESVAWISAFSTPLFSMFCLLSLNYYLRYCADGHIGKHYWMALVMFLLACLSKSLALTLPLTFLVLDYWIKREQNRRTYLEKVPFFAISIIFGALTLVTRQHAGPLDQPADFSILDRGLMVCHTVLFYWKMLIAPNGQSIWYPFEQVNGHWDWTYYASPVLLAAILFGAWRSRLKMPVLWFGILFYLSNIIFSLPWVTFGSFELCADRYNYLACLGIFAIMTALPTYFKDKKPVWESRIWAILFGLGALWLFGSGARIGKWKNTITLVESALATTGDNFGKAYLWRGTTLADEGKGDPALQDLNKAIDKNPMLYEAYKYRGNIMGVRKNYEQSIFDLSKYIAQFPDAAPEIYNRGLSFVNLGNDKAALADFNHCLDIDPDFTRAYRARGNTLLKLGETEKGNADLQEYERRKEN